MSPFFPNMNPNARFSIDHIRNDGSHYTYRFELFDTAVLFFETGCNCAKLDLLVYGQECPTNVGRVEMLDNAAKDGPEEMIASFDVVLGR